MNRRALLTAGCFLALAALTALVTGRVAQPSVSGLLVLAAAAATLAGGAGAVRRGLWPLALLLLPLGAYVLARAQIPLPEETSGIQAHVAFYARQVADGAARYLRQGFPLDPAAADLRLLVSLAVYVVSGAAAFLALSLRRPLPAVVLLLGLAGFAFTTDETVRDPWSALAFVVLAGGLLALLHPLPRERVRAADAVAGGVTAVAAAVLALSILGVTTVEAQRPLGDWRSWDITGPGNVLMRFDWMQNYPRLLHRSNDAVVMEVRSPVASYWRANVLSDFTGTLWRSGLSSRQVVPAYDNGRWVFRMRPGEGRDTQGRLVTQRFRVRATYTDHLFTGGSPAEVQTTLPLDLGVSPAGALVVEPPRGPTMAYEVTALVPDLGPTDLIGRGRYYPENIAEPYLQLPFPARAVAAGPEAPESRQEIAAADPGAAEWAGLSALNDRIVGAETDPYRIALAIQRFLHDGDFTYSLRLPESDYASPYAAFLFDTRTGYCQQFAGTMALLLRFNGVPARVAVGFTQGREEREGVFVVRRNDAHAWVEAYFPGTGWASFDPTPGRELPEGADVTAGVAGSAAASSAGGSGAGAQSETGPLGPGRARVNDPGGPGIPVLIEAESPRRWPWVVVPLAVLAGWPVGRALLRRRGLLASSPDARVRASLGLVYASLRDHGIDVPASQTLDETARLLQERFGLDAGDVPERVQAIVFGGRPADDDDVAALRALRRELTASLRAREGRLARIAALYGLRRRSPLTPPPARQTPARPARAAAAGR